MNEYERDSEAIDCLMKAGWIDSANRSEQKTLIHWTDKGISRLREIEAILTELQAFGQMTTPRQISYLLIQVAIRQGIDENGWSIAQ